MQLIVHGLLILYIGVEALSWRYLQRTIEGRLQRGILLLGLVTSLEKKRVGAGVSDM